MKFSAGSETLMDMLTEIETDRLTLRRLTLKDADDMFQYSADPEVARHVLWDAHTSVGDTRAFIRFCMRRYRAGEPASLGIALKASDKVIGTIGFMDINCQHMSAEVGYSLARTYWDLGIMTEALSALIAFGFEEMRLHRIEAQHEVNNPASGAVMRKVGMHCEGTLRGRLMNKGKYVDVDLYAILRDDYYQRRRIREGY